LSRRQVLVGAASAVAAAPPLALLYAWLVEPHWLEISTLDLPVRGLPPALDGATLAQLSDLHIGPKVSDDYIDDTFRRVRALQPDFVVCTGDWLTYDGDARLEQLARRLAGLPRGRLGTVGVLGNHDYGFGWQMEPVADRVVEIATEAGVRILRNEVATIGGLRFVGIEDIWGPRFPRVSDPATAKLSRLMTTEPTIVLSHNPDSADRPIWGDYRGWILAGHTHGGQCKPPFLPPPLLPVRNRRYTAGPIEVVEGRWLYISRGVGHLLEVRFNVRPEVPLFRLRRAF
jgi:predicted MPP superfamily phosphohydrolase